MSRIAIVLFNLGGPSGLDAVKPFLRNLFSDPAIISAPAPVRRFLSWYIALRRTSHAKRIYSKIGGSSPIRLQTEKQARALEDTLSDLGEVRAFPCMRYWHPFSDQVAEAVAEFAPDRVILLPLYPQFSTTTTGSSLSDWQRAAALNSLTMPHKKICCYAQEQGFIAAQVALILPLLQAAQTAGPTRLLLSAHGLPKKVIARGDPYQWQVEQTCAALTDGLAPGLADNGIADLDWQVCYQSRVGPMEWIGPATEDEISRAGADGVSVVLAPVAFVSEHSETLVELDMDYRELAEKVGVPSYTRVATVGTTAAFIDGLASMARSALERSDGDAGARCGNPSDGRCCPDGFTTCVHGT
ncbi:MAG: ferrochelatase [Rhodospirillaceae bacterium]|nr:ferrochelatase [Rhodospirillaceae bacterium]